jgi:hypothetical protein
LASNSRDPEQTNKQRTTPAGESPTNAQHHSQTLPLITEEIAANHATARTEATHSEPVTTPVMPPNPIRREEQGERAQPSSAGTARLPESQSSSQGAAVGAPVTAVGSEAAEAKTGDGEEKKSEGRISATQLIAGAGAAATSSVIGGQLGVAGTVIGAGIASIVTGLAVTLYSRSLDKGKEKIKEVGSKLAPAVKAQIAKNPVTERTALTGTTEALPTPAATRRTTDAAGGNADPAAASAKDVGDGSAGVDAAGETEEDKSSWWQKLRRKRVLYPAAIGVAAFGIGLGGVVMAESFTDADLSPGTSQISRSVSGQSSTADESGTDSGTSDSGSSGDGSGSGSQSGTDGNQGSTSGGTDTQNGQSTSAGDDTGTQSTNTDGTDQGTDSTTGSGSDTSGSTTADGTDTASGTSTSSGGSSSAGSSGGSNSSGSASGGSNSGSSGSGSSGSGPSGSGSSGSGSSGSGSSGSGSGGGGAASAQG